MKLGGEYSSNLLSTLYPVTVDSFDSATTWSQVIMYREPDLMELMILGGWLGAVKSNDMQLTITFPALVLQAALCQELCWC